jgi:hypothetical protein
VTPPDRREGPVSRSDIEAKLQEIRGEVDSTTERAKVPVLTIGAAVVVVVVVAAFLIGRRRGRKTTTLVEVKRL